MLHRLTRGFSSSECMCTIASFSGQVGSCRGRLMHSQSRKPGHLRRRQSSWRAFLNLLPLARSPTNYHDCRKVWEAHFNSRYWISLQHLLLLRNQCIITINGFLRPDWFFINLAQKRGNLSFSPHPFIILPLNACLDSKQVSTSQCHWEGRGGNLTFRNPPLPLRGRKLCTTSAQKCSEEGQQLHLQQSIASFPCLVHNGGAQADAQTPLCLSPCTLPALTPVYTLLSSSATCFAQPVHVQKTCGQTLHTSWFHKLSIPQIHTVRWVAFRSG